MMKSLNERQQAVLRRIVDGGYRPTSADPTTIYVLRSRGLVTTRSAYAYGTAEPTESGRALIDNPAVVAETRGSEVRSHHPAAAFDVMSSPTELLDRLTRSADHRLVIADPTPETLAAWRRLLHATRQEITVADGMVLRHSGRSRGDLVIWLEPRVETDATATAVSPVEIPERVLRPHPLVAALRSTTVGGDSNGSTLAADRVRWKVEDRLGDVMDQLEQLAAVAELRRLERALLRWRIGCGA